MTDDSDKVNARLGIYGGSSQPATSDGIDRFEALQEPTVKPGDDPLARFVMARIIEAELEPRGEVMALYDEPGGAMAHRYAGYVRRDMVAYRRIVARYLEWMTAEADAKQHAAGDFWAAHRDGLRLGVLAVANRWSDHRDYRDEWRLT